MRVILRSSEANNGDRCHRGLVGERQRRIAAARREAMDELCAGARIARDHRSEALADDEAIPGELSARPHRRAREAVDERADDRLARRTDRLAVEREDLRALTRERSRLHESQSVRRPDEDHRAVLDGVADLVVQASPDRCRLEEKRRDTARATGRMRVLEQEAADAAALLFGLHRHAADEP